MQALLPLLDWREAINRTVKTGSYDLRIYVCHIRVSPAIGDTISTIAAGFLTAWDQAWNDHDANALGDLHASDAVNVNRFGTLIVGRLPTEKALGFLHSHRGPFGHSQFLRSNSWRVAILRARRNHCAAKLAESSDAFRRNDLCDRVERYDRDIRFGA